MKVAARQYGSVTLVRGRCTACGELCLICRDGLSSCCRAKALRSTGRVVRECTGPYKRRQPSEAAKRALLDAQNGKCFWCGREFGTWVMSPKGICHECTPVWDHYVPYWYTGSSADDQFVASCRQCNSFKSARIPLNQQEEDDLRHYLIQRFKEKGWEEL